MIDVKYWLKKKDALEVESCAMMMVSCHRRRGDERSKCRMLLVAANAVPMLHARDVPLFGKTTRKDRCAHPR